MRAWGSWVLVLSAWGGPFAAGEAGCVWFVPVWVAEAVWGRVWWRSAAVWLEGVSMGAAWIDSSMF